MFLAGTGKLDDILQLFMEILQKVSVDPKHCQKIV